MAERPNIPRVPDPLDHLRSSVEKHAAATQASIAAGQAVQAAAAAAPAGEAAA